MKVYIKQLLIGGSDSLYLQGSLFHSAGKFLPTMTAFDEPARLPRAGKLVLHTVPVGDTEPGPCSEAGQRMGEGTGKLGAQAPACQEEDHLGPRSLMGLGLYL